MPKAALAERQAPADISATGLARVGMALADWAERWFPDAFIFALGAIVIAFVAGLLSGTKVPDLVSYFGQGFWSLIPFTLQMAMIIISGYVVATSPPVYRLICWLSSIPRTPRSAVAFVAFFAISTALISWGLALIFSGLLVREVVKKVDGIDYRAIGAAAYIGNCTVAGLGLSSSAALLMATPSSIPAALLAISGTIPLSQTIYTWQSLAIVFIVACTSIAVAYLGAPKFSTKTAESFGVTQGLAPQKLEERHAPAEWLEYSPLLSVAIAVLGLAYVARVFVERGPVAALDLNTYNFTFLMAGLLMHWRPRSFTRAVNSGVPATAGVLIQFPFYGGVFGIVTMSPIARNLAHFFVRISSHGTFPIVTAIYTGVLGLFVPSAGSKWVIEAPYVLQAAKDLHVPLSWVVQTYNASQTLPNFVNPFWMLPLLGILKVKARELVGYGLLLLAVDSVLVLFLVWFLARTLS